MEKYNKKSIRLTALLVSIISSLLILFTFKYFNFLSISITNTLRGFGMQLDDYVLNLLLPVGISFYTFQTLSYSIDVYKGKIKAEKHLGYYALFVSFFPQLVAGPIERPENLIPQLKAVCGKSNNPLLSNFDYQNDLTLIDKDNITTGLKYILVGFFKKIVIADTLAIFVNAVYNNLQDSNGLQIVIATILFAVQILCDFDGYTNIAIGVAKIMNIDLMKNFNNPYKALNIKDFWRRWHISLSSWFRDYVYIPLGGSRCRKYRHLINLFITFLLSGLWHGANWTFIIWGALHGLYLIIEEISYKPKMQLYNKMNIDYDSGFMQFLRRIWTFIWVCFAWIFFRANSTTDLRLIFTKLFTDWQFNLGFINNSFANMGITPLLFIFILSSILMLGILGKAFIDKPKSIYLNDDTLSISIVRKVVYLMLISIVILGWVYVVSQNGYSNAFIYFQF